MTEVGIGAPVWSADGSAVLFTEVNDQWRSYRARYHRLGDDPANDRTLYEETEDKGFSVGLSKSQDESLIFISAGDNRTTEIRFVPAADPLAEQVPEGELQAGSSGRVAVAGMLKGGVRPCDGERVVIVVGQGVDQARQPGQD